MARSKNHISLQNDEEDDPASQDPIDFLANARKIMLGNKRQRAAKRQAVEEQHAKNVKELSNKITAMFETRKAAVTKLHKERWARLEALAKERRETEKEILKIMEKMAHDREQISNAFVAVLDGQIADLQKDPNFEGTTLVDTEKTDVKGS